MKLRVLFGELWLAFGLMGCPSPASAPDAAVDRTAPDAPADVTAEAAVRDAALDAPADAPVDTGPRDVLYATDLPSYDAPPLQMPCTPGERRACTCVTGAEGAYVCHTNGRFGLCTCEAGGGDGGVPTTLPPRLRSPLSDSRVTSQRPTLRWVLPEGVTRARVMVCDDRPCTRELVRAEVEASAWRPPTPLTPGVRWWRVQGLSDAGSVVWTSATWSFGVGRRDAPNDTAIGTIHDFNGDGYADIAAGSETRFNQIHVYLGGRGGFGREPVAELSTPHLQIPDQITNYSFGMGAAVGDINGDGYSDLAVGESTFPAEGVSSRHRGHIHLYWGGPDGIRPDRGQTVFIDHRVATTTPTTLGDKLAITDFNGDGYGDLIATRWSTDANVAQVLIFTASERGVDRQVWSGLVSPRRALQDGPVMRAVGDLDADGYGEVVATAQGAGFARPSIIVMHGNPLAMTDSQLEQMNDDDPLVLDSFYALGNNVAGNDFNGDGYSDIAAASYGSTVILRGTVEGLEPDPVKITPTFGIRSLDTTNVLGVGMSVQGDLNGDGLGDLVMASSCDWDVARPLATCWSTNTYFYVGTRAGVPDQAVTWLLGEDIPHYGIEATAVPGDVNGDGYDDFVGGAPGFSDTIGFDGYVGALKVFWGGPVLGWGEPDQLVRSTGLVAIGERLY